MRFPASILAAVASSLKLKLILLIVTVLALTVGVAPWAAIKRQQHLLLAESGEHLRSLQELLKTFVGASMLAGDREQVQKLLEAVGTHEDIRSVRIFDMEGTIHFSSKPEERGTRLSPTELRDYKGLPDPVMVTREGDRLTHTVLQPLFNRPPCFACHSADQKVLGMLQIGLSLDPLQRQISALRRSALLTTLITLGVIVLGVWLTLTFFVDQPLQQLVDVMDRAKQGDLSVRADARKTDEIGSLAQHFNDMITKLHVAQDAIAHYHQEQLARADRLASLGEMAAAIAHEIRNPLTGISGALSVLSRGFPADDSRRDIVRQTQLLIERLNKTVEDILHYSRPSLPELKNVRLDDVVERSISLVEGEAKKAGVAIVREADSDRNGAAAASVCVDQHQLQQVLMNLILNAIQATANGGQIRIRTRQRGHDGLPPQASIEIEDTGKGMTAEQSAQAFQPFFSTKAHGTGLGLPIAKQIIEQHHGTISLLRSGVGHGTCVQIELPAQSAPAPGSPSA